MFSWCRNSLKVYDIWRDVEPKEIRAAKLKEEKVRAEQDLAETQRRLAEITTMLEGLNRKQQLKQEELDDLMDKQSIMQRKLDAASKLITGLGSEQKRWTEDMVTL